MRSKAITETRTLRLICPFFLVCQTAPTGDSVITTVTAQNGFEICFVLGLVRQNENVKLTTSVQTTTSREVQSYEKQASILCAGRYYADFGGDFSTKSRQKENFTSLLFISLPEICFRQTFLVACKK